MPPLVVAFPPALNFSLARPACLFAPPPSRIGRSRPARNFLFLRKSLVARVLPSAVASFHALRPAYLPIDGRPGTYYARGFPRDGDYV